MVPYTYPNLQHFEASMHKAYTAVKSKRDEMHRTNINLITKLREQHALIIYYVEPSGKANQGLKFHFVYSVYVYFHAFSFYSS